MDDSTIEKTKKDFSDAFDFCGQILKLNNHYLSLPNNNDTTSRRSVVFGQKMYSLMMGLMKEMTEQPDVNESSEDDEYFDDDDENELEIFNGDFLRQTNFPCEDWDHDYCRTNVPQFQMSNKNSGSLDVAPEAAVAGIKPSQSISIVRK